MTSYPRQILYISYNGMLDALGQSQVLPYLRKLSKEGFVFTLLSFERRPSLESAGAAGCRELHDQLAADRIEWNWLRYHQKPSLPATTYDVLQGLRYAQKLVRRNKIEMVHARSHIPAIISLGLKRRFQLKMIFDVRGLMADEYVDAEHWRKDGLRYRLVKGVERRALAAADGIVTLTERIWPIIKSDNGLTDSKINHEVIPCCVDLELFRFSSEDRKRRRQELQLGEAQRVLVYSGSIGGWYLTDKMADLFALMKRRQSNWHFLWLTTGPDEPIRKLMSEREIRESDHTIRKVSQRDVASYLSAADAGLAFYKPAPSRLATSPVKVSEYLACGLPLIINAGIGDSDSLVKENQVGVVVSDFNSSEYERATTGIVKLVSEAETSRNRSRLVAERCFDLQTIGAPRYTRLYEAVLNSNN